MDLAIFTSAPSCQGHMPIGLAVLWNSLPVALFLLALGKWILDAKLQTRYGWCCV